VGINAQERKTEVLPSVRRPYVGKCDGIFPSLITIQFVAEQTERLVIRKGPAVLYA
jgi:hypothetical protein